MMSEMAERSAVAIGTDRQRFRLTEKQQKCRSER
jgi:hypothetical protein